jgi:hypothetical protein
MVVAVTKGEREQFMNLPDAAQQVFLANVGHALTVSGRGFVLDLRGDQVVTALSGLNELQHKISSQIGHLGTGAQRYPDDVFWQILRETADIYSVGDALNDAVQFANSRVSRARV